MWFCARPRTAASNCLRKVASRRSVVSLLRRPAGAVEKHVNRHAILRAAPSVCCKPRYSSTAKGPEVAEEGLRVKVHLKGTFDDGEVFDDTSEDQPLTVVLGKGAIMPQLDEGIRGMRIGDERTFRVDSAFGEVEDSSRVIESPREHLPADCQVGSELKTADGRICKVLELSATSAKLHFSHPFAGKTANFTVKLVSCARVEPFSQLEWEMLTPGDKKTKPQDGDMVTVHYTGVLAATGAVFDSSRTSGETFTFKIGAAKVIQGWDFGLMEMTLGERCELRIPYSMGYGVKGSPPMIPSSADLIFDVELLKINDISKAE